MIFSEITFLYIFLPVVLLLYYVLPKGKNLFLLISSLVFYAYGSPHGLPYFFMVLFAGILGGYLLDHFSLPQHQTFRKIILWICLLFCIGQLFFFKYKGGSALPVGISFYSFQTMGYLIDLYRKEPMQKRNWLLFSTYVSFFPQLIAGPIVRYQDMEQDLLKKNCSFPAFQQGVERFLIGLSKKLLIADQLSEMHLLWAGSSPSVFLSWLSAIAYTLQIYFDFSGYSDMAIGMGKMFGIRLPENFNYPYVSESITEFWRRWHMTLSSWFKDYVYIPLGGSRKGMPRTIRNLLVVFMLTGLWHGIGWQFFTWGLFYGILLVMEKLFLLNILKKIPKFIGHVYTLFMVVLGFVLFAAPSLSEGFKQIQSMFGFNNLPLISSLDGYYLKDSLLLLCFAALFSFPVIPWLKKCYQENWSKSNKALPMVVSVGKSLLYPVLLLLCSAWIIGHSAQPFLYFQF